MGPWEALSVNGRQSTHRTGCPTGGAFVSAVLVVLLLSPGAAASWSGMGSYEPSTRVDETSGRMFLGADTSPVKDGVRKVYFNAFAAEQPTSLNPNLGTTQSRMELEPNVHYNALFGVWKDCNADGYVGLGDNALIEYRSELLLDTHICPRQTSGIAFNDGQWVNELLMLAQPDPCVWQSPIPRDCSTGEAFRMDSRVIYVNDTAVWGDLGKPAEDLTTKECSIRPLPRGTTSGTGALVGYADCYAEHDLVTAFDNVDRVVDPTNSLGLYFEDPDSPQSSTSRLNVHFPVNLYGNPTTGHAGVIEQDAHDDAFTMWDCAPNTAPDYEELRLDPFHPTPTRTLNPQVHDPTGSYWDSAIGLEEAVQGDCDPRTNNTLRANYRNIELESQHTSDSSQPRSRTDIVFFFTDPGQGTGDGPTDDSLGTTTTPRDLGLGHARNSTGPMWTAASTYVARGPLLLRANAKTPVRGASYETFYARVSPSDILRLGLVLPNPAPATYGQGACGSAIGPGMPSARGWVCDPTLWWRSTEGNDVRPCYSGGPEKGAQPVGQVVGTYYQMLDLDCVDGRVLPLAGLPGDGVYSSLAPYGSEGTCV